MTFWVWVIRFSFLSCESARLLAGRFRLIRRVGDACSRLQCGVAAKRYATPRRMFRFVLGGNPDFAEIDIVCNPQRANLARVEPPLWPGRRSRNRAPALTRGVTAF